MQVRKITGPRMPISSLGRSSCFRNALWRGYTFSGSGRSPSGLNQWLLKATPEQTQKAEIEQLRLARQDFMFRYQDFPSVEFKVTGVSFGDRQSILERVAAGEAVILEREPYNAYDLEAVRVSLLDGSHLGYVPRETTSKFGSITTAGRVKSVGKGQGGHFGALVFAQPRLPYLLPAFLPESGQHFPDFFRNFTEEQRQRLQQLLTENDRPSCCLTGRETDLRPLVFWRAHAEQKQFQISAVRLARRDLVEVSQIQDPSDSYALDLLSVINAWTPEEVITYVKSCTERQNSANDQWSFETSVLHDILKKLDVNVRNTA